METTKAAPPQVFSVAIRFRGLNARERALEPPSEEQPDPLLHVCNERTFTFAGKAFTFDRVFGPETGQRRLFDELLAPLVERFREQPHDATVVTYGQTSSGKTWTIDGDFYESGDPSGEQVGLLPRALSLLGSDAAQPFEFSFYEIYCERVFDLLDAGACKQKQVLEDKRANRVIIKGLVWRKANDAAGVLEVLRSVRGHRHYASTLMNANSSRSHTVFDLHRPVDRVMYKHFRVVDLAGSERVSKTGATGVTFEEGNKINQSLMCLRDVIFTLSRNSAAVVNHRGSKLTRILYASFRGRSRVLVLACCSTARDNTSETLSSLQFAYHAKHIALQLDDLKTAVSKKPDIDSLAAERRLQERLEEMQREADEREQMLQRYEIEIQRLTEEAAAATTVNDDGALQGTATVAKERWSVDVSERDEALRRVYDEECERNERYRATIETQQRLLRKKVHDNRELEREVKALQFMREMILREF